MSVANGWHLRKDISIGQIIAIITVAGGAFLAYTDLDKRVSLNTQAITKMEERTNRDLADIKETLRRIERRLDGVIDRPDRAR